VIRRHMWSPDRPLAEGFYWRYDAELTGRITIHHMVAPDDGSPLYDALQEAPVVHESGRHYWARIPHPPPTWRLEQEIKR